MYVHTYLCMFVIKLKKCNNFKDDSDMSESSMYSSVGAA